MGPHIDPCHSISAENQLCMAHQKWMQAWKCNFVVSKSKQMRVCLWIAPINFAISNLFNEITTATHTISIAEFISSNFSFIYNSVCVVVDELSNAIFPICSLLSASMHAKSQDNYMVKSIDFGLCTNRSLWCKQFRNYSFGLLNIIHEVTTKVSFISK